MGYTVSRQTFKYNFFEEPPGHVLIGLPRPFPFTYVRGRTDIATMGYSGDGSFTGVVQEVDVTVPLPVGQPDGTSNSGCEAADFAGFTGDIALIQRGTCDFSVKIANAVEAGAAAVIIFNEGNTPSARRSASAQPACPQNVPVLEMSAADGAPLVEFIRTERTAGRTVTMTFTSSTSPRCAPPRTSSPTCRAAAPTASSCPVRTSTP